MGRRFTNRIGSRRFGALVVCGLLGALAGAAPSPAVAGDVSQTEPAGDVHAKGLSRGERAALDVVSVRATGDESTGLFVTAAFAGDVQRRLGHGHLKRALIALVLEPKSSGQAPAGLVTYGGGFARRQTLVARRHGRRLRVRRRVLPVPGRERVLRETGSTDVGAIRHGNRLLFFIRGPGLSNVASVEVKAYASFRLSSARAHAAAGPPKVAQIDWKKILDERRSPTDLASAGVDATALTCDQLKALREEIAAQRATSADDLERYEPILESQRQALADYSEAAYRKAKARGEAYATKGEVRQVVDFYKDYVARLKSVVQIADRLLAQLDGLIRNCKPPNQPPVITGFSAVFGTFCSTCTLYTVEASDPEGQPLTYSWAKFPPPGSTNPGATNCGTFTENNPEANQAWWSHPNEAQNGNPGCSHEAQEHPGYISVVVTDPQGAQAQFTDTHGSANFTYP